MKWRDSSFVTTFYGSDLAAGAYHASTGKTGVVPILRGGSTSGPVELAADGDATSIDIRLTPKGTGQVRINSTCGIFLGTTDTLAASSGVIVAKACKGFYHSTLTLTAQSTMTEDQIVELKAASTTADVMPGDLVSVWCSGVSTGVIGGGFRLSTAAASRVTFLLAVPGSTGQSSWAGVLDITWADLT